ncbi:hypothetical protein B4U80_04807 [Leptotrombidium deliense]|uniref:MATH domain-containing protein n=1 Tax=Leptotrombidium deliense TaxID=299467 RepID=A0A443SKN7_9ACAR|nr:hypothetical protein B4U80_04807 [Leptotrombidium deliense]
MDPLTPQNGITFNWKIPKINDLIEKGLQMIKSPRFYISEPGYRFQLLLTPNTTYTDNSQYFGVFFRLVTGIHDSKLKFPFQQRVNLTVYSNNQNKSDISFVVTPNTDPCRLRSAFLRPTTEYDQSTRPDGCGNRRHIAMSALDNYLVNNTLTVSFTVLPDIGEPFKEATLSMKYNSFVSEYVWNINNFTATEKESRDHETISVMSSEPFYTHPKGYLMQMFVTLLPQKKAFAISTALAQGDYDRYSYYFRLLSLKFLIFSFIFFTYKSNLLSLSLIWPFPYGFEVAIVDETPGYWQRDYVVKLHPSTSDCGTAPFLHPNGFPQFCFVTIQSTQLLQLTHYQFIVNDTIRIRFTTKFNEFNSRDIASLNMDQNGKLYAEYSWLIADLENKIEKFDFSGRKIKLYKSNEFYTNGQGYLLQLILTVNCTEKNNSYLGLEMAINEGKYDSILSWPFNKTFQLIISNEREGENAQDDVLLHLNAKSSELQNSVERKHRKDVIIEINPSTDEQCDRRSFMKPIESNEPCGRKNLISFTRIKRSDGFLRLGSLLVKTRVFL